MQRASGNDAVLTSYAQKLIRFQARKLSRSRGFHPCEREDIEQNLWLAVVERAEKFDPARAKLDTFLQRVVTTAARMLFRNRQCPKRSRELRMESLDHEPHLCQQKSKPLARGISDHELLRRVGQVPRDEGQQREDVEAMAHALATMPEELRTVCRRVMGGSVAATARAMRTSRRQVRRALAAARPFFVNSEFGEE